MENDPELRGVGVFDNFLLFSLTSSGHGLRSMTKPLSFVQTLTDFLLYNFMVYSRHLYGN